MAILRVPDRFHRSLKNLALLTEEQLADIERALGRQNITQFSDELQLEVSRLITAIPEAESERVVQALMSLYVAKCEAAKSAEDVARDVVSSLESENKLQENQNGDIIWDKVLLNLTRLLSVERFDLNAKATGLLSDNQRLFLSSRIISDLRYVFANGNTPEKIIGGVLIHNLKLTYYEDGNQKDFFVTLDHKDIQKLSEDLQRALSKDKLISEELKMQNTLLVK